MMKAVLCGLFLLTSVFSAVEAAETRVALVIGNGAYRNAPPLRNPAGDANAVAASLRRLGFNVVVGTDLDQQEMIGKLRLFRQAAESADIAVVYYSGHGIQVAGENWLLPVSAKLDSDRDLQYEAVRVDSILEEAAGAKKLRLLVLDACRDNPFKQKLSSAMSGTRSASVGRGFARTEPKLSGTLIAYATRADDVALDGVGSNSPFTAAFLKHVETPGIDVRLLFGKIHDSVLAETDGKQEPAIYGSLGGDQLLLGPPAAANASNSGGTSVATEIAYWNTIKDERNPEAFLEYKRQYPHGRLNPLADARLKQLGLSPSDILARQNKVTEGGIVGSVSSYSPEGWPIVSGKVVRLFSVQTFPVKNIEFFKWFSSNVNTMVCEPRPNNTFRCLSQDNIDLAQAILLNGGSKASDDASAEYRGFESAARTEKRGVWKGKGSS